MGQIRGLRVSVAVVLLLAAPTMTAVACYSSEGLVGPGLDASDEGSLLDTFVPDTAPPPKDAGADVSDADDGNAPQPFDAACGTPTFADDFDDEAVGLNLWSPDFTSGNGLRVAPGRGGAGGAAELTIAADTIGYAQLGYALPLTDRTVVRFFFRIEESATALNIFEAINGPNVRLVVEAPPNDAASSNERTVTAIVPGNASQRWVNIKTSVWHEMQLVFDKRKNDGGFRLVAQMTLDDMFVRSFPTQFSSPETPSFFLTARRVTSRPTPSTVMFDDARFWSCTDQDL